MNHAIAPKGALTTYKLVNIAVLSLLSLMMKFLYLTLPIFPAFLELDISDLPALVGTIAFGPVAGVFIVLVKNLLHFVLNTSTAGIGEFANFIAGVALVVPMGVIYRRTRSVKGYFFGAAAGVATMVVVASLFNYFVLIPAFARMFLPLEAIIAMSAAVNSSVVDLWTLILFTIVPFNIVKGLCVVIVGYVVLFKFNLLRHMRVKES